MSITNEVADEIAQQYLIAQGHVYASNIGSNAPASFKALANHVWVTTPTSKIVTFSAGSASGLTSFTKSPSWCVQPAAVFSLKHVVEETNQKCSEKHTLRGQDLYEDLVEPKFDVVKGFAWETWRREPCVLCLSRGFD